MKNFVEPFFGTGAVLFLRDKPGALETVNDADAFVANFWRSLQHDLNAVAEAADWPVNEADLHARHLWLLGQRERLTDRLSGDPDFCDPKAAGWWVWGQCCWIGSGWCRGNGPWVSDNGVMTLRNTGQGVNRKRLEWLIGYLEWFSDRLRGVRVCCGDWSRVCGPSVTFRHGLTGVFLDPPYADSASRTSELYAVDCQKVAHDVRRWAIEQGGNRDMRIVLAGYDGEHEMPATWRVHRWEAVGGYSLIGDDDDAGGRHNRKRECLWFSPHCIDPDDFGLFREPPKV